MDGEMKFSLGWDLLLLDCWTVCGVRLEEKKEWMIEEIQNGTRRFHGRRSKGNRAIGGGGAGC